MSRVIYMRSVKRRIARAKRSWIGIGFGTDVSLLLIASLILRANDNCRSPL